MKNEHVGIPLDFTPDHVDRFEAALSDLAPNTRQAAAWVCTLAKTALASQEVAEPVGFTSGIAWHPNKNAQSEQILKVTRKAQPAYGFVFPLYSTPEPHHE